MAVSRRRSLKNAGFLLSETLAVMAISAFILVGLASVAHFLVKFVDLSVVQAQEADTIGRTMSALTRDISGLSRARWNGFEPQAFVFKGGPNSLYFAHRERGVDGLEETRVIALREIVTDAGPKLMRSEARLAATATSFDDLHFGPQRLVDTGPARLRFWYLSGAKKDKGVRQPSWQTDAMLPSAVIIEVVDAATTRLIVTATVPVRANADIGCIDTEGDSSSNPTGIPQPPVPGAGTNPGATPPVPTDPAMAGVPGQPGQPGDPAAAPGGVPGQAVSDAFCGREDAKEQASGPQASPTQPDTGTTL